MISEKLTKSYEKLMEEVIEINKLTPAQKCAVKFGGTENDKESEPFKKALKRDILISAGAGSGKTFTLTKRLVKRLVIDGDDISKKVIVTFTKEASNELKIRIANGIAEAIKVISSLEDIDADLKNALKSRLEGQIVKLGSAQISTIDSFCLKIVKENFASLGLDAGFRMADESESEALCNDSISEVIDEFFDGKGLGGKNTREYSDFLCLVDTLSTFSGDTNLKKALLDLYKSLITTKDGIETLLRINSVSIGDDFMKTPFGMAIRENFVCGLRHYIGFCDYGLKLCEYSEDTRDFFEETFKSDKQLLTDLLTVATHTSYPVYPKIQEMLGAIKYKQAKNGAKKAVVFTPEGDEFLGSWFDDERKKLKNFLKKMKEEYFCLSDDAIEQELSKTKRVCASLYAILNAFDKRYSEKKRLLGVCDFNDISRFAISLLWRDGKPSDLANELAKKYDEIYVDEYQDTNFVQDSVFSAISTNNRFLVGDIKQSIYRFRSAEPEIFSDYRKRFSPIEFNEKNEPIFDTSEGVVGYSLFMNENFRCDESVIDFANIISSFMFMTSLAPEEDEKFCMSQSIAYEEKDNLGFAKRDAGNPPDDVEVLIIDRDDVADDGDGDDGSGDDDSSGGGDDEAKDLKNHYIEAENIANKICELLANKYLANGQKITADKIAILLRSFRAPAEFYINALRKRGIPCEYKGDEHFFEKGEVLLALDVLHAIDNPLRDTYLAGAMLSGVFGFELCDLVKIKANAKETSSLLDAIEKYSENDKLKERLDKFIEKLNFYRNEARKKTAFDVISMVLTDTSLRQDLNESERASLYKLYDLARGFEKGKYKGLSSFLRHIENANGKTSKVLLGDIDTPSVKVMTVHASKGLEYEVCFVSSCGSELTCRDNNEPILYHRDLGVSSYIFRDGGVAKFDSLFRRAMQLSTSKSFYEEEMRMLYVAMTRARSKLYITGIFSNKSKAPCKEKLDNAKRTSNFASRYSVLHTKSFIELITHALCKAGKGETIKIIPSNTAPKDPHGDKIDEKILAERQKRREKMDKKAVLELQGELNRRFEFEYPYEYLSKLPSKLAISELHPFMLDKSKDGNKNEDEKVQTENGNENNLADDKISSEVTSEAEFELSLSKEDRDIFSSCKYSIATLPDFAIEQKGENDATPAEKGTATHMFMQFCKFSNLKGENGVSCELERLCEEKFISEAIKKLVNVEHLENFVKSDLFGELVDAEARNEIWREFRFNIFLPASEFTKEPKLQNEKILVQGVTDCIYKDKDGNLVLVDYKTDSVTEENYIGKLVGRYKDQLMYYKEAVNIIFGKYPDKTLLYCVPLAKTVPVYAKLKK